MKTIPSIACRFWISSECAAYSAAHVGLRSKNFLMRSVAGSEDDVTYDCKPKEAALSRSVNGNDETLMPDTMTASKIRNIHRRLVESQANSPSNIVPCARTRGIYFGGRRYGTNPRSNMQHTSTPLYSQHRNANLTPSVFSAI